jgi:hypothetical protein
LEKINPEISEGADGLKDDLLIVAKKGGKLLRNALTVMSQMVKLYILLMIQKLMHSILKPSENLIP